MIQPLQAGDAFLADVRQAQNEEGTLHLWWLGQSGFLVQWQGRHLLFDPYLSDALTKKYAGTDKPHVRMTRRVVAPGRLGLVEVVTSTHNHTDHLDAETLGPLQKANPDVRIVVPEANRLFAADRLGVDPETLTGLDAGTSATVADFKLTGVPAAHEKLEQDEDGRHRFLGFIAEAGPWTLYHSGDTMRYDGMAERLSAWDIDVAILPINGKKPERRVAGNLDGPEAAALAKEIGAGLAIPCHYEMFAFNTAPPDAFRAACEKLGQPYRVLRAGERWSGRKS